ncbi:MAG: PQQ-like beta-propeller repeat protein [Planctomycetota bacterium]|nr:PQQ-like beta-propeller repeat protein [Planctomycetota bacterium]
MTFAKPLGNAALLLAALAVALCGWARATEQQDLIQTSEIEGRKVVMPPDLKLDLDWYSPSVDPAAGNIVRGWVKGELVLLETDKNYLICVRREDGTEQWRAILEQELRYEPCVTANNVVVNVKNFLVAIEKRSGEVRWRMLPDFVMSNTPLVIDPAAYPKAYGKDWQNLESIYVGSQNGRMHSVASRGRVTTYVRDRAGSATYAAPDFDLLYPWHKTLPTRMRITTPVKLYDELLYFTAEDKCVYAVNRDGEGREPYTMQGEPVTPITVTSATAYVGSRDFRLYALDRLTLKKKWEYPCGALPLGNIYSDEPTEKTLVCLATENDGVHGLRVTPTRGGGKNDALIVPESYEFSWKVPGATGIVTSSERLVYLGYDRLSGFEAYKQVSCVDKDSGKVVWKSESKGVRFYIEFQNAWRRTDQPMRLYAVTEDNRLVCYKEKTANLGPVVEKKAEKKEAKNPGQAHAGDNK